MCVLAEARGQPKMSLEICLPPCLGEAGSFVDLDLVKWARLSGHFREPSVSVSRALEFQENATVPDFSACVLGAKLSPSVLEGLTT